MDELGFQNLIIKAVRREGGFGHKMSNRFLVGVPDLLLKLKTVSSGLWEVKMVDRPKHKKTVMLNVSPLQAKWLSQFHAVGGPCGVIAGMRSDEGLSIGVYPFRHLEDEPPPYEVCVSSFVLLPKGARESTIVSTILGKM